MKKYGIVPYDILKGCFSYFYYEVNITLNTKSD